jgi:hypothetical protein
MPYIPEQHKKYALLPKTRDMEWEVFEYPDLREYGDMRKDLMPYGYKSLESYLNHIDYLISKTESIILRNKLNELKYDMVRLNNKEIWSVLKYVGNLNDELYLITGHVYYWPCTEGDSIYMGVIDEAEFTAYWYDIYPDEWEILEDPTGMARKTLEQSDF